MPRKFLFAVILMVAVFSLQLSLVMACGPTEIQIYDDMGNPVCISSGSGGTGGATPGGSTGNAGGGSVAPGNGSVGNPGQAPINLVDPLGNRTIIQIISDVISYLIYIGVPIFALMILIGGFQILTAREDPNKVKSGRQTIMWATIGFAIILIAKGIALILLQILSGQ